MPVKPDSPPVSVGALAVHPRAVRILQPHARPAGVLLVTAVQGDGDDVPPGDDDQLLHAVAAEHLQVDDGLAVGEHLDLLDGHRVDRTLRRRRFVHRLDHPTIV